MKMVITNKKKYFKILFVLLIISMLSMGGCSNNRNSELVQQLKKDEFNIAGYSKDDSDLPGGYSLQNYILKDGTPNKDVSKRTTILVRYLKKSKGLDSIVFIRKATNEDEQNIYCVYGGNDKCFDTKTSEEKEIEIAAQPKMKKEFNKFLKKYDMTKDEFIDLVEYIYDNGGKLE